MKNPKERALQFGVQSVEIGLQIAMVFAKSNRALMLSEVAKATGMPASKVHRYLVSLCRGGLIEQDPVTSRYDLSPGAIQLGLAAQSRLDEFRKVDAILEELHSLSGVPVAASIWSDRGPIIVRRVESAGLLAISTRLGSVVPIVNSSIGRVFASMLPDLADPLIKKELAAGAIPRFQGRTLTRSAFADLLRKSRDDGVAVAYGDLLIGLASIAAPVFTAGNRLVMVISMLFIPSDQYSDIDRYIPILREAAQKLSTQLGWRADSD